MRKAFLVRYRTERQDFECTVSSVPVFVDQGRLFFFQWMIKQVQLQIRYRPYPL